MKASTSYNLYALGAFLIFTGIALGGSERFRVHALLTIGVGGLAMAIASKLSE